MKILHCCLANFYIDDYGYQENILPKMHKLQGHDVQILASTETYISNHALGYLKPSSYRTSDNIPITRIPYSSKIPFLIVRKLRVYEGVGSFLKKYGPDIIFIHDSQFISIKEIAHYAKRNPETIIYVDGHTDFVNSAKNWISKNILHKIIYRWCTKKIEPYTKKFYGTLPARVDFFKDVYGTPPEKTELLHLGVDGTLIDFSQKEDIRLKVRSQLGISESDFVIVTGGKIDRRKNIHVLMNAVNSLNIENIKLLIFGTPSDEMKMEFEFLTQSSNIYSVGWMSAERISSYFFAADLGFFPGTHSVVWEQAVGLGLPCVFKRWEGIQHVDIGGNCLFLDTSEEREIKEYILRLYTDRHLLNSMKIEATVKGIPKFSFYEIARRAIER